MNKEFVTYEQSLALKELGFDEPCLCVYNKHIMHHHIFMSNINDINDQPKNSELYEISITAPLKQQVFRWFREKYQFHPEIVVQLGFKHWNAHILPSGEWLKRPTPTGFNTYDEAENACIDKLIELAKQQ